MKQHFLNAFFFVLCALCLPVQAMEVKAIRLTEKVVLDGKLSEPFWRDDLGISTFVQLDPTEGGQPSEKTVVDVAYDDEALYIAARMYDSDPKAIVARLARKDVDANSDAFYVFLDSYHDGRSGFYFALNAAGTKYDGTLYNDNWDDNSWDGVWDGRTTIDEKGWTAEIRIPYSQLRFQKKDSYDWGINFKRIIVRKNESDYLVFTPKNGSGFVSRFPALSGLERISPPRRFEVVPYITAKQSLTHPSNSDPFHDGSAFTPGAGADMRLGIGTNLTLNASVNPDFGQVEVDPAVVNLSDVETFFSEKRPFFIEGSSIFNFGEGGASSYWGFNWQGPQFFYSRRIGRAPQGSTPDAEFLDYPAGTQILGAAKLTGKIWNGWNIGTLHAITDREFARTSASKNSLEVEPQAYYGVTRLQKEFHEGRQGFGFLTTLAERNFSDNRLKDEINYSALAAGFDGWTFLDKKKTWVVTGWTGFSHVNGDQTRILQLQQDSRHYFQRPDADHVQIDPNATSLKGSSGRFSLNKENGNVFFNSAFGWVSPGFEINDLGFLGRADQMNLHAGGGYRWTQPGKFYRKTNLGLFAFRSNDFGGTRTWSGLFHNGYFQMLNYHSFEWFLAYNPDNISISQTRGGPKMLNPGGFEGDLYYSTDSRKDIVIGIGGHRNDYAKDSWRYSSIYGSIQWKPGSNLSITFTPNLEKSHDGAAYVDTINDPAAIETFGKSYVFGELEQQTFSAGLRVNWTFSPRLSLQFYGQPLISSGDYHDFKSLAQPGSYNFHPSAAEPNPDFNFKSLRGNAILRWEYTPGSTVYFVWTQNRVDVEDTGAFRMGHSVTRLWSAKPDNIFLVKWSYYWSL